MDDPVYALFGILILTLLAMPSSAFGAQMEVLIGPEVEVKPSFKFLRVVFIDYPEGGELAGILQGKKIHVSFSADSSAPGMPGLIEKINSYLDAQKSKVSVTDIKLNYNVDFVGGQKSASIEYNIEIIPSMTDYMQVVGNSVFVDSQWRGIKIAGPVVLETSELGKIDINTPESVLAVILPEVYEKISKTDSKQILEQELLDASGISDLPLSKWHFLFDPTAIMPESKAFGFEGNLLSHYSMGECKIGVTCGDRTWKSEFVLDKKYAIRAIESQDDATISIQGYAVFTKLGGVEVFGVTSDAPEKPNTATGEFPIFIIYGMAGMAAIVAVGFFVMSSRKLKREDGQSQRGIDPSQLRSVATSTSSGSYHTVRGEAQLRDPTHHEKTKSVYEN